MKYTTNKMIQLVYLSSCPNHSVTNNLEDFP